MRRRLDVIGSPGEEACLMELTRRDLSRTMGPSRRLECWGSEATAYWERCRCTAYRSPRIGQWKTGERCSETVPFVQGHLSRRLTPATRPPVRTPSGRSGSEDFHLLSWTSVPACRRPI